MAIETHGVTPDDVLTDLPFADGSVTSSSTGFTTGDLEAWIRRGAGQINAILMGRNMDPSSLSEDWSETVQSAVIAYAQAKALSSREFGEDQTERAWSEWGTLRKIIRERETDAGDSIDASATVRSNVDTSSDKEAPQFGTEWSP